MIIGKKINLEAGVLGMMYMAFRSALQACKYTELFHRGQQNRTLLIETLPLVI